MLLALYGDERSSQVLVALELELLALLEVLLPLLLLLELEAAVVAADASDSPPPADVDATASPFVKLTASDCVRTEGMAATTTPLTGAEEVVVVVVEAYDDELAAVAALVPSPFAVRAATSLSIVLFVGRSKLLVFVRQVLYAPQWVHFKPTTWNFTVDSL